jgi:hypothetical protein
MGVMVGRSVLSPSRMTHHHHRLILGNLGNVLGRHFLERLDQLGGNPLAFRNCLTVDALIPKFTSSGREPIAFATFNLLSWETTTPMMLPFLSYIGPPLLPF